jgi:hypothetical protein
MVPGVQIWDCGWVGKVHRVWIGKVPGIRYGLWKVLLELAKEYF